ncbi:LOW QUALITY PROTEIN: alanine--glyoxylate aminotransferase-like [Liolophura sinensis]|uniref:LOW QUALITY PROTEIN: alanine--glyoxylate aminotransferase-like n=1 Tax=Liolophura sinensis TaxID=3198878 RepID=UPI003158515D
MATASASRLRIVASKSGQLKPNSFTKGNRKMSSITAPPECLKKRLNFPLKHLLGPGPTNVSPRVLAANALPLLGHMHTDFFEILDETKAGIQYVFQTKNEWTYAISAAGHGAMEAACCNLLEPGEVALVGINGLWGQRFAEMADRNGCVVQRMTKPQGHVFSMDEIEQGLKEHKPAALFLTQGESSGSTCHPLEGVGELCHKHNCLLVVDSVAALGGVPLFMDAWGIDCLYSGAQKVLSSPPGASPISYSERARQKVLNRKTKPRSYYFDAMELANYWGCDDKPRRYHHTAPISTIFAIREGLARVAEEGLENMWAKQREVTQVLYDGLERLGLELLVKDKSIQLPTVTGIKVPDDVNWKVVSDFAMKEYNTEIAGGLGDLAGKIWRVGLMGYNCTPDNARLALRALEEGLQHARAQK